MPVVLREKIHKLCAPVPPSKACECSDAQKLGKVSVVALLLGAGPSLHFLPSSLRKAQRAEPYLPLKRTETQTHVVAEERKQMAVYGGLPFNLLRFKKKNR